MMRPAKRGVASGQSSRTSWVSAIAAYGSVLSPGPHIQQIFLGAVTIIAVALDMFLTKLRKSRDARRSCKRAICTREFISAGAGANGRFRSATRRIADLALRAVGGGP